MPGRQTLDLPFGGGLDRATGAATADPTSFGDLRNVHLLAGRAALRRGLARSLLSVWGTEIVGVFTVRAQGLAAAIICDAASRDVRLYIVDASGASAANVGTLWTVPAAASLPPRVIAADSYDRLLIAHDEPNVAFRQVTMVYSPGDGTLAPLLLDLTRTGAVAAKFRGVQRHLNYVVGWGYGTSADPDRPETLRISQPGDPTSFDPEHYFLAGVRGDPILGVGYCGGVLAIHKTAESYKLVGHDRATFGVLPLDPLFGLIASRAHVSVLDTSYLWSLHGPRSTAGGPTEDLELPLDIGGPSPDALAAAGNPDYAFAFFDPTEREVVFVFGQWAYVLHLRDGQRRWSYRQYAVPLSSAGLIYVGGGITIVIAAHGEIASTAAVAPDYTYDPLLPAVQPGTSPAITVNWTAVGGALVGDEQAEVWVKSHFSGGWSRKAIVAASALTATVRVTHFLTVHDVAVRFTRAGVPAAAYANIDPATWPATARATQQTGGPIISFAVGRWYRVAGVQGMQVVYIGPGWKRNGFNPELVYEVRKSSDAGATWTAMAPPGASTGNYPEFLDLPDGDYGATMRFDIRVVGPAATTARVATADKLVAIQPPSAVTTLASVLDALHYHDHEATWTNGESSADGATTELRGRHNPPYGGGTYGATVSFGAGLTTGVARCPIAAPAPSPVDAIVEARSVLGTDVSAWVVGSAFTEP